jgi:hypothetical protein
VVPALLGLRPTPVDIRLHIAYSRRKVNRFRQSSNIRLNSDDKNVKYIDRRGKANFLTDGEF